MSETYIELLLEGRALLEDVDQFVEQWHTESTRKELHEFLGMEWDEYALWVEKPAALRFIVYARRTRQPLENVLQKYGDMAVAARAPDAAEARAVVEWLRQTGRWPSGPGGTRR